MDLQDNPILIKARGELDELQKKVAEKKKFINTLYVYSELPPPFADDEVETSVSQTATNVLKSIKPDEYFGQPAATAVRMVLKRYRDAQKAPVELDDIIKTLKEGGYRFTAADDKGAKNSLTVMISKNMDFVRIGQKYGLREWYPNLISKKKIKIRFAPADGKAVAVSEESAESEVEEIEPMEEGSSQAEQIA